jgi:flagellar protein FlaF
VTRALIEAAQAEPANYKVRIEALDWNRRLWVALASDCASADNTLPTELRARIVSISLWVSKHSSKVMRQKESFEPLIEINRMMMQGLSASEAA